jgi:outer membrane protein OmpA-like peptidoglycan-associated protein
MTMKIAFTFFILVCAIVTRAQKSTDTIKLYFDFGISELRNSDLHRIDSLVYHDILQPGKKLAIIGYADYVGGDTANQHLSEARANNVAEYLKAMGFSTEQLQMVIGRGEVKRNEMTALSGNAPDRRVDLIPGGIPEPSKPAEKPKPKRPVIDIGSLKKNEAIRLDNIFFLPGSHRWTEASKPALQKLLATLKEYPAVKIRIEGHICCVLEGTTDGYDYDAENFYLSRNRAGAVYNYLIKNGIAANRLTYEGFGKTRPVVRIERSPEDENRNRRVEIRILEK